MLKQKGVAQIMGKLMQIVVKQFLYYNYYQGAPLELIVSDVLDHYRTYSMLERLLALPTKLSEQPSFQLEPQSRSLLIEKYRNF